MIRRFIKWLLHVLHIRRRREVNLLEALKDLLPYAFAAIAIASIFKQLAPLLPKLPWYERIWWHIKSRVWLVRILIVGY